MRSLRIAAFLLLVVLPANAGDDIEAVSALWSDFVSALRRGDYPRAYGLFSAESREAMPYAGFIQEYGPLTLALEMVLAKPESRSTRLEGEWAELTYGGHRVDTGRPFRVVVAAVRNHGAWALVAGRNEARERTEAAARSMLLALAGLRNLPSAGELSADMVAGAEANYPVLRQYRFDTTGGALKALPLSKGLRAFHIDAWGQVRQGEYSSTGSPPEKTAAGAFPGPGAGVRALGPIPELGEAVAQSQAAPKQATAIVDGLPELTEPNIPAGLGVPGAVPEEMPELPPPPAFFDNPELPRIGEPPKVLEPDRFELPDMIG